MESSPLATLGDVRKAIDGMADEIAKLLMPREDWGTSPAQVAAAAAAEAMFGPA